jgi:vacuolar protein sorting-associated protein 41
VQEQALLLVEFDHELMGKRKEEGQPPFDGPGTAIMLLVDHIHSIPVSFASPFFLLRSYSFNRLLVSSYNFKRDHIIYFYI